MPRPYAKWLWSLLIESELLEHRVPRLLLAADERGELFRRHRAHIATAGHQLLLNIRLVEHLAQVIAHLANNGIRRTHGSYKPLPPDCLETGERLRHRRHVREI